MYFKVRDEMLIYLSQIYQREQVLGEMKKTVMNIKSEEEIEDEIGTCISKKEEEKVSKPTRDKISRLGDKLVDTTEIMLKSIKKFK